MEVLFEALLGILGAVLEGVLDAAGDAALEQLARVAGKGFHELSAWFASFFS